MKIPNPEFDGQTKSKLGNSLFSSLVSDFISKELSIYLEENVTFAKNVFDKVLQAAKVKESLLETRELVEENQH